ncbi:Nitrilase family, member 2 [Seminavis robusta]|uniref:Nitrilase family, member 2 n=1 Tax=Seminavis robusta TaxID=568900 RepID=A0A9N8EAJ3_9STRA|nr:Nitrilase family, member 2 [Seminavis robusta]|eukprot:Sro886_g216190.1 Nitrilase family, member 2 (219) ;mRNA; f:15160-15816
MPLSNTAIVLPADFVPTEHTIIIGRGRVIKQHSANKKFDKMVESCAKEYAAAPCKAEKGLLLTRMINEIHDAAPMAGFVRKDPTTNQWTLVEEALARQTAAQAMRNVLSHSYRSSKQFKSKRRLQQIAAAKQQQVQAPTPVFTMSLPLRCVSPSESSVSSQESSSRSTCRRSDTVALSKDTVFILMSAFGNNVSENPFEPRPLATTQVDVFEPIPLAL